MKAGSTLALPFLFQKANAAPPASPYGYNLIEKKFQV
jgi:hypothetical protein